MVTLKVISVLSSGITCGFCIHVGLVELPGFIRMERFCTGCTCCNSSVHASTIVTLGGSAWSGFLLCL